MARKIRDTQKTLTKCRVDTQSILSSCSIKTFQVLSALNFHQDASERALFCESQVTGEAVLGVFDPECRRSTLSWFYNGRLDAT